MEATARTEYGVEPGQASALELVFNLPSVEGRRIDVLSRSDERFLMAGGSSALVEAMAQAAGEPHHHLSAALTRDRPAWVAARG